MHSTNPHHLPSVTLVGMKEIILREGRWKVEFHDCEGAEFFIKMVNNKIKYKGILLQVFPWVFSYSVDQVWDQLEKIANLERQKAQDSKGFGTKVNAVTNNGCAVSLSMGKDQRAATHSTANHLWQASDVKFIQGKVADPSAKGGQEKNRQNDHVRNQDKHQSGKGKGQSQGKNRDRKVKDYSQQGRDQYGSKWTKSGGKSSGKGGKGQQKTGNQEDSQVNGNPF